MGSTDDPSLPVLPAASDRLVMFGVKGFQREDRNTGGISTWVRADDGDHILASAGLSFRDPNRRVISVLSHRQDDRRLPRIRSDAVAHTYYALLRSQGHPAKGPRWPDGWGIPGVPQVDWEAASIDVDDWPTAFEICRFDRGYWAAIGRTVEADVILTSFGVPFEGLQLERVEEVVKRRPPFPPAVS